MVESPRALAAKALAYSAMYDRREPGEDELYAWTAALANARGLTERDLMTAIDEWNTHPDYPNPKPRDILPIAKRHRRRRLHLDRFALLPGEGVKAPPNFRQMVEAEKERHRRMREANNE